MAFLKTADKNVFMWEVGSVEHKKVQHSLTLDQKVIFLEADCLMLFNLTGLFNHNG